MSAPPTRSWGAVYGPFLTLGLQLAITVVAFFFLGKWLDTLCGTSPWLMLGGIALGIIGGIISFVRTASALGKKENDEAAARRKEHTGESQG